MGWKEVVPGCAYRKLLKAHVELIAETVAKIGEQ